MDRRTEDRLILRRAIIISEYDHSYDCPDCGELGFPHDDSLARWRCTNNDCWSPCYDVHVMRS